MEESRDDPRTRPALAAGEPRGALSAEQALLLGILERTLFDIRLLSRSDRRVDREELERAREWIDSDYCGATHRGFSFVFVCTHLGLSPEKVRELARELEPPTGKLRQHHVVNAVRRDDGRLVMKAFLLLVAFVVGCFADGGRIEDDRVHVEPTPAFVRCTNARRCA